MPSSSPSPPSPADLAGVLAQRLQAAGEAIKAHLEKASGAMDQLRRRAGAPLPANDSLRPPATPAPVLWKVLRHPASGAHFVVRAAVELPDCPCAFGPTHVDGRAITFAEATAFANYALLDKLRQPTPAPLMNLTPEDLSAHAARLRALYANPPASGR
jgi:hypothetical protein